MDLVSQEGSLDDTKKLHKKLHDKFWDTLLPERYLCEALPDKLMLEAFKELNIHDLKDILCNMEPRDKQFQKVECSPTNQYHIKSSQSNVKEHLTAYQLQSHFGRHKMKDFSLL